MSWQPGDTVRLSTTFKVDDVPTDPDTVTLVVQHPDGTQDSFTTADFGNPSTGVYTRDVEVDAPGRWMWRWRGTGAAAGVDEGVFTVNVSLLDTPMLTTVDAVKQELESTATDDDDLIERLIVAASAAIIAYTDRQFVPLDTTDTTRTFDLAAGGDVPIDALAATPTSITIFDRFGIEYGNTIDPAIDVAYLPFNRGGGPITTIRFRNPYWPAGGYVQIEGRWGYPVVPSDVEYACILTVRDWMTKSDAEWNLPPGVDTGITTVGVGSVFRFPIRAKQLLDPYRRIPVAVA
jgi:hypothetical protein